MFSTAEELDRHLGDLAGRAYADAFDAEAAFVRAQEDEENVSSILQACRDHRFDPKHIALVAALVDPSKAAKTAAEAALTAADHRSTTAIGAKKMSEHHLRMQAQGAAGKFYGADPGPAGAGGGGGTNSGRPGGVLPEPGRERQCTFFYSHGGGRCKADPEPGEERCSDHAAEVYGGDLAAHMPTGAQTAAGADTAGGPRPDPNATRHRPCDSCGNPGAGNRTRVYDTRTDYICDDCVANHNWSNWQVQPDGSLLHGNATSPVHPTADTPEAARARTRLGRAATALEEDAKREHLPETVAARKRAGAEDVRRYGRALAEGRPYDPLEAEQVATAGECSGIIIDNERNVQGQLDASDVWVSAEEKTRVRENYQRERAVRDRLVRDGYLVRVDEEIDGVKQIPFYALASYGGLTHEEAEEYNRRQDAANAAAAAAVRRVTAQQTQRYDVPDPGGVREEDS